MQVNSRSLYMYVCYKSRECFNYNARRRRNLFEMCWVIFWSVLIELLFQFVACQVCACGLGTGVGEVVEPQGRGIGAGRAGAGQWMWNEQAETLHLQNLQHLSVTLIKAKGRRGRGSQRGRGRLREWGLGVNISTSHWQAKVKHAQSRAQDLAKFLTGWKEGNECELEAYAA